MEEVWQELEDLKYEKEILHAKYQAKCNQYECLREVHNQQSMKLQEAVDKIEKQSIDICAKVEEISFVKQMCEDLKKSFSEKESVILHLNKANENLKTNLKEQTLKMKVQNQELVSALDESQARREEQEQTIRAYKLEIDGVRNLLLQSQKKCADLEEKVCVLPCMRKAHEVLSQIEQDKIKVEDQLKWKNEQFRHLEEAYDKLQTEFKVCKKEWVLEKSNLLDEISTLQVNLDCQTRIAQDIQSKLQMCNQALAHEESQRKLLALQLSESKKFYENVVMEFEEEKLNVEKLTGKRDEDIAALRHVLATKDMLYKETELRNSHLDQVNQELQSTLKEFQEAQTDGADAVASLKALRQRFRSLEQVQRDCSEKLKYCEAGWEAELEILEKQLGECHSELLARDKQLYDFQEQIECYYSYILQQKLENEEISVELMVLKSKLTDFFPYIDSMESDMKFRKTESQKQVADMKEQLQEISSALFCSRSETRSLHETVETLQMKVGHLESVEQQYLALRKDHSLCKEHLEETSRHLECYKMQASRRESELQEELDKVIDALVRTNAALLEKTTQLGKYEFELQQVKMFAERIEKLKSELVIQLDRCQQDQSIVRGELEVSILAKMEVEKILAAERQNFKSTKEEQDKLIEELQKKFVLLEEDHMRQQFEHVVLTIVEIQKKAEEKLEILQLTENEGRRLTSLSKDIDLLEHEIARSKGETAMLIELEKEVAKEFLKEKQNVIVDIQCQMSSINEDFTQVVEERTACKHLVMYLERGKIFQALEKIVTVQILAEHEAQYLSCLSSELEEEIGMLQLQLKAKEEHSVKAIRNLEQMKVDLLMERMQWENEKIGLVSELKSMYDRNRLLEEQKERLSAEIKSLRQMIGDLWIGREALVGHMLEVTNLVEHEKELSRCLQRLMCKAGEDGSSANCPEENVQTNGKYYDMNHSIFHITKNVRSPDRRVPLKDHNF